MPDSPAVLLQKTYACMALALAGRGCEAYNVLVGDVSRVTDDEGNASFHVAFDRSKNSTTTTSDRSLAVITGHLEVRTINAFLALRPAGALGPVEKAKKFFRKIGKPTAAGKLKMSWAAQNVGKATLANIGREVSIDITVLYMLLTHMLICTHIYLLGGEGLGPGALAAVHGTLLAQERADLWGQRWHDPASADGHVWPQV
jgi:hypothetical protein